MKNPGPCPDPDKFILVATREGKHWRRKRGTVKKAKTNKVLSRNAMLTAPTNEAASRFLRLLHPYVFSLDKGRLHAKLAGRLKKCINAQGKMCFSSLEGMEFQPRHPMNNLLQFEPQVRKRKGWLEVAIIIDEGTVRQFSRLVTDYYFELVIVYGHLNRKRSMRLLEDVSALYPIEPMERSVCELSLEIPDGPWVAMLKVSCMEGERKSAPGRNYGMRVIAYGV